MKNNLKNILKNKKITQKELATMTGITQSAINRYIKQNRVPNSYNLLKMAKALSVKPEDILVLEEETNV